MAPAAGHHTSKKAAKAFAELELIDMVRRATPIAEDMACLGLGDVQRYDTSEDLVMTRVLELAGQDDIPDVPDSEVNDLESFMYAAYALGIAIGQLTSPRLFAKGGAR